jgi:hypothetical protein
MAGACPVHPDGVGIRKKINPATKETTRFQPAVRNVGKALFLHDGRAAGDQRPLTAIFHLSLIHLTHDRNHRNCGHTETADMLRDIIGISEPLTLFRPFFRGTVGA